MTAEDALKAIEQHEQPIEVPKEVKDALVGVLHTRSITEPQPTKEDIMNNIHLPNPNAIQYTHGGTLGAPEPQPTLADVINNICTQLQLLATVISQSKAQPDGENSLQECVSLTLQQADWFKDVIRQELVALDIVPIAQDAVEAVVENEVENYFDNRFDPSDHFDFGDAVQDAVSDQIDDVVRDRLDDIVQEQLEDVVAEKLKSIRVVFD
jgi:hypothetical protein